jgi:WD40 repeat protein
MSLFVQCACGEQLEAPEEYAGKQALCPQCRQPVVFPVPPPPLDLEAPDENRLTLEPLAQVEETPPPEVPRLELLDDDVEEVGATYAITAEGAAREAQVGTRTTEVVSALGELGNFYLTQDDAIVEFVVLSPDHAMALAGVDNSVSVLNVRSGHIPLRFTQHRSKVLCGCFTADGKLALTGDEAGDVILWDVATGKLIHLFQLHKGAVRHVASANECALAVSCGADGTARLLNLKRGKQVYFLREDDAQITCADFSRDDNLLVIGTSDGLVHLCETQELKPVHTLKDPPPGRIAAVRFCQDGEFVVAAGLQTGLMLGRHATAARWQRRHGTAKLRYRHEVQSALSNAEAIAIAPSGGSVVYGGRPQHETRYDEPGRTAAAAVLLSSLATGVNMPLVVPGSVTVSHTLFKVASVETGHTRHSWPGHMGRRGLATITCVNISNDGTRGISGGTDGRVQIWGLNR